MPDFFSFKYHNGNLSILDQRKLPLSEEWIKYNNYKDVALAIKNMVVRGAPAIGCVAAYGFLLGVIENRNVPDLQNKIKEIANTLINTRPTAVNLFWAIKRMQNIDIDQNIDIYIQKLQKEADSIAFEDVSSCKKIGNYGAELILGNDISILTHCNAGALATANYGTALGVVRSIFHQDRLKMVYADDTRPRQQGAKLTTWELLKDNIPVTLIPDTAASFLMKQGKINAVITGADRITRNGDTANKIGTYQIAIAAKYHNIPMYIAAPLSTFDRKAQKGEEIIIEERSPDEVKGINLCQTAPKNVPVYNPAFDITPAELITAIITDYGIITPPYSKNISTFLGNNSDY